ncbi:aminotransferase class V-fold PLP-dependent enzyme [Candidatus Saccharibacteria bacterium]|nr:aminotransferase class V-fold PLP-dependent enzyme [Candidatus Saccharibacteria bacterium]
MIAKSSKPRQSDSMGSVTMSVGSKADFPFFKNRPDLAYLDSAATTQKPQVVLDALQNFYANQNANPGRALYDLGHDATKLHAKCRQAVADFIGASPEQIIFTSGCTEGLNLVALHFAELLQGSIANLAYAAEIQQQSSADSVLAQFRKSLQSSILKPGDEIVLSIFEHHSNLVPWQKLAQKSGAKLKYIYDFPTDPSELTGALEQAITPRTKIVAVTAVSNVTGEKFPAEQITARAHAVGAKVVLDAAQAVAHLPLDAKKLDVDFLTFSGHKMYAPMGIGVLYVKNPIEFMPSFFGGGAILQVSEKQTILADDVSRFEPGTRSLADEVGLKAAIEWLSKKRQSANSSELVQKKSNVAKAKAEPVQTLVQSAYNQLSELPFVELISLRDAVGIVSFNLYRSVEHTPENLIHSHDVATLLNDEGVCIRAGNHCAEPLMQHLGIPGCCRASFGLYNSVSDVDKLIFTIKEAWEILK